MKLTNDGLGVDDVNSDASNFILYPNPAHNQFIIHTKSDFKNVKDYDIFRKLIKAFPTQYEYVVSELSKGLYLVNIKSETGSFVQKLIIE